jgi:hypothetical protein
LVKRNFSELHLTIGCGMGLSSRIAQSSDALVGNYSVELTLTTTEGKEFYQIGKIMNSQTTYYSLIVWLKGKGVVKLGIKYPGKQLMCIMVMR